MSDFWLREASVTYEMENGVREFTYPEYEIKFRMEFGKDGEPDFCVIDIYNLLADTEEMFKVEEDSGKKLTLRAGYGGDSGILIVGIIKHVAVFNEGNDRICEIEVHDTAVSYDKVINRSYVPGTTAEQILKQIITVESGLELGKIQLPINLIYVEGISFSGSPKEIIQEIAEDCNAEIHIVHGMIYVLPIGGVRDDTVILSPTTGMIGSPKRIDGEESEILWEVESLLNYRIRHGTKVELNSDKVKRANGIYVVDSGFHVNTGSEFKTTVKLKLPGE
jgi:hypothetical protein